MSDSSKNRKGHSSGSSSQDRQGNHPGPSSGSSLVVPVRPRREVRESRSPSSNPSGLGPRSSSTHRVDPSRVAQTAVSFPPHLPFPPTILESFNHPLPHYEGGNSLSVRKPHDSGSLSSKTEPPRFCLPPKTTPSGEKGARIVNDRFGSLRHLQGEFIYKPEAASRLLSEGDLTHATALYLLHPINQVLSALRPGTKCLAQHPGKSIRTDVCYKNATSTLAVIELKARGTICISEFKDTLREIDKDEKIAKKQMDEYNGEAIVNGGTLFDENSLPLIKQASNYALAEATRYVALFDWNCLVLITFNIDTTKSLKARRDATVGDYCHLEIILESHEMRKALLGFLCRAHNL
ncbi:hypothetical protein F5X98DRAFT_129642 [Xylaria grammica]|nr:hypothetical protein F5X98DRAFT_129642 [Xylaria grammica]